MTPTRRHSPRPARHATLRIIFGLVLLLLVPTIAPAQAPAPAPAPPEPPKNIIPNGDFESVAPFINLFDGVDSGENVTVPKSNGPVYLEGASFSHIAFSASPCFADVNGDKLPDLVVGSPLGYLYWFPNIGKKGEPAFGPGRLVQTFIGTAARINVVDWNNDGKMDILFGNIEGEVNLLLNSGTVAEPKWNTAMDKPRWFMPPGAGIPPPQIGYDAPKVKIGTEPVTIGVYSSPILADWNKDGAPDLIVGEGSYSANSIHIWLNSGSRGSPSFRNDQKFYLAYGEGREQLTPSVYDWNGDGLPDLIVGDRDGRVALYLGTNEAIKEPKKVTPVEFTEFLTVDGRERLGYLISVYACDYNEDGIPDLVYGTSSGKVMVALGAKDDKGVIELSNATQVKGKDEAKDFHQPASWVDQELYGSMTYGWSAYHGTAPIPAVVSKQEDPNAEIKQGERSYHFSWFDKFWGWIWCNQGNIKEWAGLPNGYTEGMYYTTVSTLPFIMGEQYQLSFWYKGNDMKLTYLISYNEAVPDPKKKGPASQFGHNYAEGGLQMGNAWKEYKKVIRLDGTKNKDVNTNGKENSGYFSLYFYGRGDGWVDDVILIQLPKK